jgi:hypothetical protein
VYQQRHPLAQTQFWFPSPLPYSLAEQHLLPVWLKRLTEIIDSTEQFE